MKGVLLRVHDYMTAHRRVALVLLLVLLAGGIFGALRLRYEEDVTEFLPRSEKSAKSAAVYEGLGEQGRITVVFRPTGEGAEEDVMEAVDLFCEGVGKELHLRARADESDAMEAIKEVGEEIALYLTDGDYSRIDSLLADTTYIATSLKEARQMLTMPMPAMASEMVAADPLGLFSPALSRLEALSPSESFKVEEGYVFDEEGNGYAFLESPYGSGDTRRNGELAQRLQGRMDSVEAALGGRVRVTAVGAPLIAVSNASQIKHDSFLATLIAIVLIAIILWRSMGRKRNIVWMAFSVLCGWIFALGIIAIFKTEISIIVVGIGSVLLGIAVNYPLHYLEHLKEHPDHRETLKEMIEPLLTGNVTTVAAFACLLFVKASAMRDLGLFASLMLVGTIFFVMVFLPLWAKAGKRKTENTQATHRFHMAPAKPWLFWAMLLLTLPLAWFSTKVEFDSDLHNINYMTAQQREDLDLLGRNVGDDELTYIVAEGRTLEEALERNDSLSLPGVAAILPSLSRQRHALERWNRMLEEHPDLASRVEKEARKAGFAERAFQPFYDRLERSYTPRQVDEGSVGYSLAKDHIVHVGEATYIVNYLHGSTESRNHGMTELGKGSFAFSQSDVGSTLVEALNDDFNYILYVCSIVVFLFLWLALGRLELALLSFLPMAMGWIWILGIMALAGIKFNIVNIILATFIFGQGDDYTIFITEGLMYEYAYGRKRLGDYRRSVVLSAVLMTVGIGVLVISQHPAMRSLGEVAMVGMASVIVMACVVPPLVFRWLTTKGGRLREVPLTLLRLLRTVWIIVVFVLFAFIIITPYTLVYKLVGRDSEQKRLRFHGMICRFAGFALRHLPGVGYHMHNDRGENFERAAVIVANHQSHLDLLCILSLTPKLVVLTNDWVWRNPVYGAIIRYAEFYPASNGYESNLAPLQRLLERGYSVVVFPEGTRSVDGRIGRFHKGAFALAKQCGVDILPLYLHGLRDVMPKNDIVLREGSIDVAIGQRIAAADIADDARVAAQELRAHFVEQYTRFSQSVETEDYFRPLVRHQYLYKGREVARRRPGEKALLAALAHPEEQFTVELDSEEDCLVAQSCAVCPKNLIFQTKP